jgi:hypothetical protein
MEKGNLVIDEIKLIIKKELLDMAFQISGLNKGGVPFTKMGGLWGKSDWR